MFCAPLAHARSPELRKAGGDPLPTRLRQGEATTARIVYLDPDGDRPQEAWLVIEGGREPVRMPADLKGAAKSYREGVTLQWPVAPLAPGRYAVHFEATSIDGHARYPEQGALPLVVVSLLAKWLLLGAGLFLALAVLPGVVFMGARRAADPAGAARTGLAVGVLAGYGWFLWLFASIYTLPVFAAAGIVAVGLTIWLWLVRH
jgi:hypothetical protein